MELLVATRKGLFQMIKESGNWRIRARSFAGDPVSMIHWDPRDRTLYAALGTGHFGSKLHRSDDLGDHWTEIATPSYPANTEGDDHVPWSLELIWSIASAGNDQPGSLWCGTIPGGLFHSNDRGNSWKLNESLWHSERRKTWQGGGYDHPGIHSICIDPADSNRITIAVSIGGVLRSTDGGQSWQTMGKGLRAEYVPAQLANDPDQQDPHLITQCQGQPDIWWMQHHNGIFVSTDNCENWHEIENVKPSGFGFTVQVHPADGKTAWFIPAIKDEARYPCDGKLIVNRTTDGGKTFRALSNGLPQDESYDLVYRHAFAVDPTGNTLLFGSTTGNLWISEDGGEQWQFISAHLPPVMVVKIIDPLR